MRAVWDEKIPFPRYEDMKPVGGVVHVDIHTAVPGDYQFSLGSAAIKHKGVFYVSWLNSWRAENEPNSILAEKRSYDGGNTWDEYRKGFYSDDGFGRSHGVYLEHEGRLYVFCPRAHFDAWIYEDLLMEAYVLEENGEYTYLGLVTDEFFWPLCAPIKLDNGGYLIAGLRVDYYHKADGELTQKSYGAVALCDGKDILKWRVVTVPTPCGWAESTVLKYDDRLVMLARCGDTGFAQISESYDNGNTWSALVPSNFPAADSKLYAGTLCDGTRYVIFNVLGREYRRTLAIATAPAGDHPFDKVQILRDDFTKKPQFRENNEWSYPYVYEDIEQQKLFVVYTGDKENSVMSVLPLDKILRG